MDGTRASGEGPHNSVGKGRQALVAEDDETTRKLVVDLLRVMGFEVILQFEGAGEALQALSRHPVDIVISDWNMPNISGLEFLKAMRASPDRRIAQTRFLMLTVHSDQEKVLEAVDADVDGYLVKPFSPKIFFDRVQNVLQADRSASSEGAAYYYVE